jgi:hypothetical protein
VDPADYERLRKYDWLTRKGTYSFYARRYADGDKGRKGALIYMHQQIIKAPKGKVIDHINGDGMDNRSANLRAASYSQNMYNRKKQSGAFTSKYKGVCWSKAKRKWLASVGHEKKQIYLGYFHSEIEAAKARDRAAKKYHGEFVYLNFPEEE